MIIFNDYILVMIINIFVITAEKPTLKITFILLQNKKKWMKALIHFTIHLKDILFQLI